MILISKKSKLSSKIICFNKEIEILWNKLKLLKQKRSSLHSFSKLFKDSKAIILKKYLFLRLIRIIIFIRINIFILQLPKQCPQLQIKNIILTTNNLKYLLVLQNSIFLDLSNFLLNQTNINHKINLIILIHQWSKVILIAHFFII